MRRWPLGLALLALASGCTPKDKLPPLVTVNGEPISGKALDLELRLAGKGAGSANDLLEGLIDQTLILQEGRRLGVGLSEDALRSAETQARNGTDEASLTASLAERGATMKEWRDRLAQAALADEVVRQAIRNKVEIGRQEVQDYYWEHLPAFRRSERRLVRQIYCKDRASAEAALRELQLGDPFADVARRRGQGPEAADGGLIGPLSRLQMPQAIGKAVLKLKPGQHSPLFHSPWGWHIVYLEEVQKEQGDSLEQASPKAQARLLRDKEQTLYRLWLEHLREQAKIERKAVEPALSAPTKAGP